MSRASAGANLTRGTVRVLAVGRRQATIDRDPVFAVDLVVRRQGLPPQLMATSLRVPLDRVREFRVGCEAPVGLDDANLMVLDIDWAGLGPASPGPDAA
jgi:hypothetical protein